MEKLGNRQTKDRIADMLREEILSGRLADGEELAQEQLAEQLEVSRMPVREALQLLESEGLVLRMPNRHMQVVGFSERTARENLRMVAAVEAELALLLIEGEALDEGNPPPDGTSIHEWISEQVHNAYLRKLHNRLLAGYPAYVLRQRGGEYFAGQNKTIRTALANRDAAGLECAIRGYYDDMARELIGLSKGERQ